MAESSPPPPSTTKECLPGGPKPKEDPPDISELNYMTEQHKKTRELPNLSDCHGCNRRINYSNPNERLQPFDSFWRIVLLCKKCSKQVNDGQLCPYCFKDTSMYVSDCYSCANCYRVVHKDCIVHFGNSAPWSYCSNKSGSSFIVCIDCWIPDKLKRSIRGKRKRRGQNEAMIFNPRIVHGKCSGKVSGGGRSSANAAKDAKRALEKKLVVAAKAKEVALRKALAARNAVELASNALNLVATKCPIGEESENEKEGLVGSSSNGSDSERVGDDAELAFQLHLAMNSSRRLLKKFSPLKDRCLKLLKLSDSSSNNGKEGNDCCNLTGSGELKPDIITYSYKKRKELQKSATDASKTSNCTDSYLLKPELLKYRRKNKKQKECEQPSVVVEANGSFVCVDTCGVKPESVTHEQPSVVEANRSSVCVDTCGVKPESVTHEQTSVLDASGSSVCVDTCAVKPESVTNEQPSVVEASGSSVCMDTCGVKPESLTHEQPSVVEANGSSVCVDTCGVKPESVTHEQPSVVEVNGISICIDIHGVKPESVTHELNNVERKENQQSELDVNGSSKLIEFSGLKPEIFTCEQNDESRKELQQSGVEAIGCCTFSDSAMPKPDLVSHKQNNRERIECKEFETNAKGGCSYTDPRSLNPELVTSMRKNDMMKECGQSGECGHLGYADGSVATHNHAEDSSLVRESQSSLQDASKDELCGNDGRLAAPEGCSVDVGADGRKSVSGGEVSTQENSGGLHKRLTDGGGEVSTQENSGDTNSDRYSMKYSRRTASGLYQLANFV